MSWIRWLAIGSWSLMGLSWLWSLVPARGRGTLCYRYTDEHGTEIEVHRG